MRWIGRWAAALAGALALALVLGSRDAAAAQVMLASPGVEQRSAQPGEAYGGAVRVRNAGNEPQSATLYLTDYEVQPGGSTRFPEPGSTARSNARWIRVSPSQVTIPPGREVIVRYRVAVPADAALSGSYGSLLMVEGAAPRGTEGAEGVEGAQQRGGNEITVRATVRYAVRLITHIGPADEPGMERTDPR